MPSMGLYNFKFREGSFEALVIMLQYLITITTTISSDLGSGQDAEESYI